MLLPLTATLTARLFYPYDLDWMEGGVLAHAYYLRQGLLFPSPSLDLVPFVYPPGYPALLALLPLHPIVGRLLSLTGTLAAAAAIVSLGRNTAWAALFAVCFLSTYALGGGFFDLVRPDGVMLGLLAWAITLALRPRTARSLLISALLLVAAGFIKHSAFAFAPALLLGVLARDGRRTALRYGAAIALPTTALLIALQLATHGLGWTYLISVPAAHPFISRRLFPGALRELSQATPLLWAGLAIVAARHCRPRGLLLSSALGVSLSTALLLSSPAPTGWSAVPIGLGATALGALLGLSMASLWENPPTGFGRSGSPVQITSTAQVFTQEQVFWGCLLLSAVLSSVALRAHHGGYLNVHLPAFWMVTAAAASVLQRLDRRLLSALLTVQIGGLALTIPHHKLRPTQEDRAQLDAVVEELRTIDGPIWSPFAVWLPTYAGHAPHAHLIGLWDIDHPTGPLYPSTAQFAEAVRVHHWAAIVTSQRPLAYGVNTYYPETTPLHTHSTRSGWAVRLTQIRSE